LKVIVVETAPTFQGQDLAVRLGLAGIETTLIPDSAVFAMLARVNKVCVCVFLFFACLFCVFWFFSL
jgi:translation initiation factor 2B subunit (eIF-2B alpha/beta/delta family)